MSFNTTLLSALCLYLLLVQTQAILLTTGTNSLCDAPGCSCQRSSVLHCRCSPKQELSMRSSGYDYLPMLISSVTIENCYKLSVSSKCLEKLEGLRQVRLSNITHLELEEYAFSWGSSEILESYSYPGINVTVERSGIVKVPGYAFRGSINTVSLVRCSIGEIKPLAFSNLAATERVELLECDVETVQPQAFKKFITDFFLVTGGRIGLLPSHSVIDVQIRRDLRLQDVLLGRVRSLAVRVNGPTGFRIQGCTFSLLEGDAFRVLTQGPVFIEDNRFLEMGKAPFVGVTVDPRFATHGGKQEIVFENNTLLAFSEYALLFNTSDFKPTIDRIVIDKPCTCPDITSWTTKLVKYTSHNKEAAVPGVGRLVWCKQAKWETVAETYYGKHCTSRHTTVFAVVAVLVAVLVAVAAAALIGCCFYRRRMKRYINVPTDSNRHSTYSAGSNRIMVVPEGKTYRETELHVIVERAEPITEFKMQPIITELNAKD